MYYNSADQTATAEIRIDNQNLGSFDLVDMEFSIWGGRECHRQHDHYG